MGRAIRILVLEDNRRDFELISKALHRGGVNFTATRVEAREDFIKELETAAPDVVLSDHGLPQFDGISALKITRGRRPELPFIFVTGSTSPADQVRMASLDLSATAYVPKDRLQDLRPTIERALKHRPGGTEAQEDLGPGRLFECAIEQVKEAVVITTPDLELPGPTIVYVNHAFTEMTGYSAEEVIGKTPRILQGKNTDRKVLDRLKEQLGRGEDFQGETFNYRKDGTEFILQWEITPIRDVRKEITHFVAVQRDMTELRLEQATTMSLLRQQASRETYEKEARRIATILNRLTEAFVSLDQSWMYTFVNERAGELLGRKPEYLIGKCIWEEFPKGADQPFRRAYEKAVAEQEAVVFDAFYEPWQKWFESRVYPDPDGLCIFFRDVTEQRQRREELQASLERFELATRVTQDIIYDWDIKGGQIRWNQNYYSIFGYDFAAPEIQVELWAKHLHPEDRARVETSLTGALAGNANFWQCEYRFERGDGSHAEVMDRGYIVRDHAGAAVRMVGAMVDVSEQKQHNRSLYETTRRVTSILESITDAFFSVDREWRFTYVNRQAERLLKRSREQLIGRNVWKEFPESVGSAFDQRYQQAVEDRVTVKFEAYYSLLDAWLFVTAYPSPDGLSVYFHDITDRKKAEEALRVSEEFSRRIIESSSDCIKILDMEGRLIGMTEGGQKLMEICDLQPLLGQLWVDFWKNDHFADAKKALADACAGQLGRFQGACPTMAGTPKFWDVICTPILGADGKPERVLSVSRDITDIKKAEEDRRAIEARKEAIVSSALDAIITIDGESMVQDWNPAAEKIFGYKREEVLGKSMVELIIPPYLRERHREGIERSSTDQEPRHPGRRYELEAQRANGEIFPAEISISRIPTTGAPLFTGFIRDISQRKRAEIKLREQEERLRLIVEGAEDYAIFTMEPNGAVSSWNSGAEKILKYPRDEMVGLSGSVIFTAEDLENGADKAEMQTALTEGMAADERWHVRKGGDRFWANGLMRALKDDSGNVRGFLKILRDDTRRRQARQEIERLNAQLEERVRQRTAELQEVNRELEAFSYSVSHDLRAPLRHIKAFGEMLEETAAVKLDADETQFLKKISQSAENMMVLIDDLLSFSRMMRAEVATTAFPLRELVEEIVESFRFETKGREVRWSIGELPFVNGDKPMLRQVILNLLSNAVKYTQPRNVAQIEINARDEGETHTIFVRDNGVGFDQRYAHKLFGVFQRLHGNDRFEGTGIGLANVRKIVERHGGRVWAEGEVEKGATFYFSLPKNASVTHSDIRTASDTGN